MSDELRRLMDRARLRCRAYSLRAGDVWLTRRVVVVLSIASNRELLALPARHNPRTCALGVGLRESRAHPKPNGSWLHRARRDCGDAPLLCRLGRHAP